MGVVPEGGLGHLGEVDGFCAVNWAVAVRGLNEVPLLFLSSAQGTQGGLKWRIRQYYKKQWLETRSKLY